MVKNKGQVNTGMIIGLGLTAIIAFAGSVGLSSRWANDKLERVNDKVAEQGREIGQVDVKVETKFSEIDRRLYNVEIDTKAINGKIDRLLGIYGIKNDSAR